MTIRDRYYTIRETIEEAALASGRDKEAVTLVAVTKYVEVERIAQAIVLGVTSVGENRVQELLSKIDFFTKSKIDVNLIGQLQTNKVKYILNNVKLIQSMDRLELAREVDRRARAANIISDVLIEVNVGKEEQKGGVAEEELPRFLDELSAFENVRVKGLMCIPPPGDEDEARRHFSRMKRLFEDLKCSRIPNVAMEHLSMGMSGDYRAAILEGSTMVRIGTALFGERNA